MASKWIDFNRGSDSNNGNSASAPYKTLAKISGLTFAAGDVISLANDSVWTINQTISTSNKIVLNNCNGARGNPVTITGYNPPGTSLSSRPKIIHNFSPLSTDWTWDAVNGAWYITFPYGQDSGSLVMLGWPQVLRYAQHIRVKSQGQVFFADAQYESQATPNKFYLTAPPTVDPTTYYGGVTYANHNVAAFSFTNGGNYTVFDGIDFEMCGTGIELIVNGTSSVVGFEVRNCSFTRLACALRANGAGSAGSNLYFNFHDNKLYESAGYGIHTQGQYVSFDINNNTAYGGNNCFSDGGTIAYVQSSNSLTAARLYSNTVWFAKNGTGGSYYDGSGIYCDIGADNIDIFANKFFKCARAMQDNTGKKIRWYGNEAYDCNVFLTISDAAGAGAGNCTVAHNVARRCTVKAGQPQGKDADTIGAMISYYMASPTGRTLTMINNVFEGAGPVAAANGGIKLGSIPQNLTFGNNFVTGAAFAVRDVNGNDISSGKNCITSGDPKFVGDNDSRILSGSVLHKAGMISGRYRGADLSFLDTPPPIGSRSLNSTTRPSR